MPDIDRIIEEALKPLVNGDALYDHKPFFPRCSAAVRAALKAAGYVIVPASDHEHRGSGVKLVDPDFGAPTGFRSE